MLSESRERKSDVFWVFNPMTKQKTTVLLYGEAQYILHIMAVQTNRESLHFIISFLNPHIIYPLAGSLHKVFTKSSNRESLRFIANFLNPHIICPLTGSLHKVFLRVLSFFLREKTNKFCIPLSCQKLSPILPHKNFSIRSILSFSG